MIELLDITKKYGKLKSLDQLTVKFEQGKMIGLIGGNGSGKTTLLKVAAGLLTPDTGIATFEGDKITRDIGSKIAYMSDSDALFPYFTVADLFKFYESQFPDFNKIKAKEIADFLNIKMTSKMGALSKGHRGRVKIAVTLGREVNYYLLDEPFSGLDPMVRAEIGKGLIQFIDPDRQTAIISTHEIKEVEPLLDEIIVLKDGKLLAHEDVDQIREIHGVDTTTWMISLFKTSDENRKGSE